MAGNVWEWTRSLWGAEVGKPAFAYPYRLDDGGEELDASDDVLRVLRGGSFLYGRTSVRCAARRGTRPDDRADRFGFRVVLLPALSTLNL